MNDFVKKGFLILLVALLLFSVSSSSAPASKAKVDKRVDAAFSDSGEVSVIVLTKGGRNGRSIASVQKFKREFSSIGGFSARVSKAELERLKNDPYVSEIVIDGERTIMLDQSAGIVNAARVWGLIFNSTNITGKYETACVIDTGVNYSHANMGGCTSANFTGGNCSKVVSGYDFVNDDNDPMDDHSHGTHVAGIIASTNTTYRGIAPDANIVALKACNSGGSCADSNIISSIDWCVYNASRFNISVISMSLGGGLYTSWCDGSESAFAASIDSAVAKNISVIVASGNDGSSTQISAPGCIRNATSVGSVTKADAVSSFSNRNNVTDLFAPGSSITSLNYQGGTKTLSGTSMATPHVSGAFLLVKQYMKVAYNNSTISPFDIESSLNFSGVRIDDTAGSGYNFSRIDAFAAIKRLDKFPPNITMALNTLANSSNTSNTYIFVNITADEMLSSAVLELDNGSKSNYSMNSASGNLLSWSINQSASFGSFTYRVYGNDSVSWGVSEERTIQINNTAPIITWHFPNISVNVSIAEPANQSFNITFSDSENIPEVAWYVNSSLAKASGNLSYSGNYSSAGHFNITVVVSDGSLDASQSWTLEINNTNRIPVLNFSNQSLLEDTGVSFIISASDADNDTVAFSINDSRFSANSSSGAINFSSPQNFNGAIQLNVTAADLLDNASAILYVNVTPVNDAPLLVQPDNLTFNETQWANISFSAGDVDNDSLVFGINDSRFSIIGPNASYLTTINDSGAYQITVNVTDGGLSASRNFTLTIIDQFDSDGDGVADVYDSDDDNDGIPDDIDSLVGNISSISSGTVSRNVTVDNSTSLLSFNGSRIVEFKDANVTLVQFSFNFSSSSLNLANITYEKQRGANTSGFLLTRGVFLQENQTKTFFLDNVNTSINTVCIKDAEIESISNITASCNSTNETLVVCNGTQQGSYNCTLVIETSKYQITGLKFSGVVEQCPDFDNDSYYDSSCGSGTDCNDNSKSVNPAASETCGNGIDEDCSGSDAACPSTSSSSSGGGGGGGGGSGGGSAKPSLGKASQFYDLIPASQETAMKTRNSAFSVSRILFYPESQVSQLTVSIELVNVSRLGEATANAYQYFNISLSEKIVLKNARIDFSVNKSWYLSDNLDPVSTKMMRYNSAWESYPTVRINESESQYYYYASVPAFSIFAVSAGHPAVFETKTETAAENKSEDALPAENPNSSLEGPVFPNVEKRNDTAPEASQVSVNGKGGQNGQNKKNLMLIAALFLVAAAALWAALARKSRKL